jgi:hypothetical protein
LRTNGARGSSFSRIKYVPLKRGGSAKNLSAVKNPHSVLTIRRSNT